MQIGCPLTSLQIVLVTVVEVWPKVFSPWILAVIALIAGMVWTASFLVLLPMYHHRMNQLHVAFAVRGPAQGAAQGMMLCFVC